VRAEILIRAADLAASCGPDVDEAIRLWSAAGGIDGGRNAQAWLSVAFLFGRHHRLVLCTGLGPDPTQGSGTVISATGPFAVRYDIDAIL
jgi:hypothetical protein